MPPPATLTYRATPTVRLNGADDERIANLITHLAMTESEGGLSALELRLSNSASLTTGSAEYAFDASGDLAVGAALIVGAGDSSAPAEIFRGYVTGLEGVFDEGGPPSFVILAEDALQKLRFKRRTAVYENQSIADIVQQIASDHGLSPQVTGLSQNFGTQVQMNESDLAFLRRLLARVDGDLQIVGTDLQAAARADLGRGELELTLGDQLKSARVTADLAHQITQATVKGWDVSGGSAMNGDGQENALGPGEGQKGGEAMDEAFGARPHHTCHEITFNQSEVDALANSVRNARARRFVRVVGVAVGDPALRVGTNVKLHGLGDWFSNTFRVVRTQHLFDLTEGYRTEFAGECAFLGRSS